MLHGRTPSRCSCTAATASVAYCGPFGPLSQTTFVAACMHASVRACAFGAVLDQFGTTGIPRDTASPLAVSATSGEHILSAEGSERERRGKGGGATDNSHGRTGDDRRRDGVGLSFGLRMRVHRRHAGRTSAGMLSKSTAHGAHVKTAAGTAAPSGQNSAHTARTNQVCSDDQPQVSDGASRDAYS